jgi:hypothetical protein
MIGSPVTTPTTASYKNMMNPSVENPNTGI